PLSKKQHALYEELKTNIESVTLSNATILLTVGDAKELDEDLSSIVHKLRDELEPDALIVLAEIPSGVQMVARATTEKVNVGALTKHFGGGGHTRAAAALIKDQSILSLKETLLKTLPNYIQQTKTVAEIMSRGPLLLAPDIPVQEVSNQMQLYGFEGYPVVRDGKVIGLVTRRAVDRTLRHKLNLTVQEIMEAGNITVSEEASIERLQRIMTETGWGQIPVTDNSAEKIIGIVTRTDLLKILAPQEITQQADNLSKNLEERLSPARLSLLKAVAQAAKAKETALYIVGGFVRDLLINRPSQDYDLVVEGDAIALGNDLVHQYGGSLIIHKQFGTAKWQIASIRDSLAAQLGSPTMDKLAANDLPKFLDLVSARKEFYTHPSALPTVESGSIKLDLHRRDFTINTLAMRLDGRHYGQVYDYWGGKADLVKGIVRVLHSLSFVDDPTRILRAVRFEQRFSYQIGERTIELLTSALPLLERVSGDRIRHELNVILQEPDYQLIISRLNNLHIFPSIHHALVWDEKNSERMEKSQKVSPENFWQFDITHPAYPLDLILRYVLWFISLPSINAASLMGRLRMPGWLTKIVIGACNLNEHLPALKNAQPSQAVALLENVPRVAIYAHYLVAEDKKVKHVLKKFAEKWYMIQPGITGDHLRERGFPPGPYYREVLITLRDAWLDGKITSSKQEAKLLEKILKNEKSD
ncbi:MAG: CBS domain-containing protein, partial [Chloroflexota bacterium]